MWFPTPLMIPLNLCIERNTRIFNSHSIDVAKIEIIIKLQLIHILDANNPIMNITVGEITLLQECPSIYKL